MANIDKYKKIFIETFEIDETKLNGLQYQDIKEWDSVGHMSLIAALEDSFDIMMDTDDIIDSLMAVSSEKELRIILFEILGIIVSDTGLGGKEKMFAEHFAGRCKIDPGLVDKMAGLLTDYADVYQDITSLDL